MMSGIHGFASLRTRPNVPVDPALLVPVRRCVRCGCVLRRSNPTDTCMPCGAGVIDIPGWLITLVDYNPDDRFHLEELAAVVRPVTPAERLEAVQRRNAEMVTAWQGGESVESIAARYGLARTSARDIVYKVTGSGRNRDQLAHHRRK